MKHIQRRQFSFRKTSIKVSLKIPSLQASSLSLCFKPASRCLLFSKTNSIEARKSGKTVRRLGTIIQSIFCAQSGAGNPLEFLEIVRWESVPRGSFARPWKLSSHPFSRPNWLPLGLRGKRMYVRTLCQWRYYQTKRGWPHSMSMGLCPLRARWSPAIIFWR